MISLVKSHSFTGTRRVYNGNADCSIGGDKAVGDAYASVYLSDYNEHGLCAEIVTFVSFDEYDDGMYEVVQMSTIGRAVWDDDEGTFLRPDDSADINYDHPEVFAYDDLETAQAVCTRWGRTDMSYCLHLRPQEVKA